MSHQSYPRLSLFKTENLDPSGEIHAIKAEDEETTKTDQEIGAGRKNVTKIVNGFYLSN